MGREWPIIALTTTKHSSRKPAFRWGMWGLLLAVALGCNAQQLAKTLWPPDEPRDSFGDWASARNFLEGRAVYERLSAARLRYLDYVHPDENFFEWNYHPPTTVCLCMPLACLPYPLAHFCWNKLVVIALFTGAWLIVRELNVRPGPWLLVGAVILLTSRTFNREVFECNWNHVLLLLLTGTWMGARRQRPYLSACCLAAAMAVKLYPAALLLYFLARRQWNTVLATLALFASINLASMSLLGPQTYHDYYAMVMAKAPDLRGRPRNFALPGTCNKLFNPSPLACGSGISRLEPLLLRPDLEWCCTFAGCALLVATCAWTAYRAKDVEAQDHAFGLHLIAMLTMSPVLWPPYLNLALMPLLWLWLRLPKRVLPRLVFWTCLVILWHDPGTWVRWAKCMASTEWWDAAVASPWLGVTLVAVHFYALAAVFMLCAFYLPFAARLAKRNATPQPDHERSQLRMPQAA